jgi:type I restriction enzyme S subunit
MSARTQASKQAIRITTLGEIGTIFGGLTGKSKTDFTNGNARYVSYVNVFNNLAVDTKKDDFVKVESNERQRTLQHGDIIFTGSSETPEDVGMSSVVTSEIDEPIYLNSFCIGYRLTDKNTIDPEFAKHLFRSEELRKQIVRTASGVTRFNVSKLRLAKVKIPIIDLSEQKRIANILDQFDALVNDLSSGLPAEIKARRQQYEHYRDQLLRFPRQESAIA